MIAVRTKKVITNVCIPYPRTNRPKRVRGSGSRPRVRVKVEAWEFIWTAS
jgi:hypothetical protein